MATERTALMKLTTQVLGYSFGFYFFTTMSLLAISYSATFLFWSPPLQAVFIAGAVSSALAGFLGTFGINLAVSTGPLPSTFFLIVDWWMEGDLVWNSKKRTPNNRAQILATAAMIAISFGLIVGSAYTARVLVGALNPAFLHGNYTMATDGVALVFFALLATVFYHFFFLQQISTDDGFGIIVVIAITQFVFTTISWLMFRSSGNFIVDIGMLLAANATTAQTWISPVAYLIALVLTLLGYYFIFRADVSRAAKDYKRSIKMGDDLEQGGDVKDDEVQILLDAKNNQQTDISAAKTRRSDFSGF